MTQLKEIPPRRLLPEQIKWIDEKYGHAFFRDGRRMISHKP
jgi:hypothetical protein